MEELKQRIRELMHEMELQTENRHMNDMEYLRYVTLQDVLDIADEL